MKNKKYSYDMIYESRNMLFGIAAMLVLMVHATQYVWPDSMAAVKKIFAEGGMGVDIFLLLSGVGLYRSYTNAAGIKGFYKRRMQRILPAFIPLALVFYAIIVLQRGESFIDYLLHVSTLSFWVKNETCTWYVSYIIIFYLLYPIIYKMIHKIPLWGGG